MSKNRDDEIDAIWSAVPDSAAYRLLMARWKAERAKKAGQTAKILPFKRKFDKSKLSL